MTLTEKILAKAAGKARSEPGENIWVDVDVLMTHDVCGPGTIGVFKQHFGQDARVWDNERVVIIPDHYIFTQDEKARRNIEILREFAREQQLPYFYDVGTERYKGVCHIALPEEGHTRPGEVLLGTDSHTCTAGAFGEFATGVGNTDAGFVMGTGRIWLKVPPTLCFVYEGTPPPWIMAKDLILATIGLIGCDGATYKAMEFRGDALKQLGRIASEYAGEVINDRGVRFDPIVEERMTLCNMVIEAGGKNGVIEPDEITIRFVEERMIAAGTKRPFEPLQSDKDAHYEATYTIPVEQLEPVVARPHSPDNTVPVSRVAGEKLDRAYIGSCTGGKLLDMIAAAKILKGRTVAIPTYVVPATSEVLAALDRVRVGDKTLREIFEAAGCIVGPPSCGACLGGPLDTLGRLNEPLKCISSTNRNFPGRMGHKEAQVFLASPLTVAASAVRGSITDPRDLLQ